MLSLDAYCICHGEYGIGKFSFVGRYLLKARPLGLLKLDLLKA